MQNKALASNQPSNQCYLCAYLYVCVTLLVLIVLNVDIIVHDKNTMLVKFVYLPSDARKAHFMILMVIVQGDNNKKIKINHGHVL